MFKQRIINLEQTSIYSAAPDSCKTYGFRLSGPLGYMRVILQKKCLLINKNKMLCVLSTTNDSFAGTYHALLKNACRGVFCGYKQFLEVRGVGYKIIKIGSGIQLDLGFSAPVIFTNFTDLSVSVKKSRFLKVFGTSLNLVNQTISRLRLFKKPEPYKGKGLRYLNEIVLRKEGKKKK